MNPVLPENFFVPDCEARLMPDGRMYIYGSYDISGSRDYCSKELHCFSTDDLENWVDHGVIFRNDDSFVGFPRCKDTPLYAPDAIERGGKYYLYVCGPDKSTKGYEGVAVADSPTGPFSAAETMQIADGDGIDPTVFVDDDGHAYYFWGQYTLRGGELLDDMKTLIPESINRAVLTEWEHGFHEGASIRKRGDKYYMVYTDSSRGKATCMSYAVAQSPLGPYKKGGVIIDNVYCDPDSWNNHGSIACFKDKWYVFYHRSSQNSNTSRRVCIEPIEFDENGYIKEVMPTSQGVSDSLDATKYIRAASACRMMKNCCIAPVDGREMLTNCGKPHWDICDWAEFKYIDFGAGNITRAQLKVRGKGKITFKCENDYTLGSAEFDTADFAEIGCSIAKIQGEHTLWLCLECGVFDLDGFVFKE